MPMKLSFADYAGMILRRCGKPMHIKDITSNALNAGLRTNGKTPIATMGVVLSRDSHFKKLSEGMFTLAKGNKR